MSSIRKEGKFKELLEKLFLEYNNHDNLISFIEENFETSDSLIVAQDFAEELSLYETDIEEIFNTDFSI
ncbi:hypothetical protein [Lysinibacillus sp. NPDC093216]|uniref:hypothetical protein n=1 Tax=Lysinibacillus sp. NPDC093216 TaxID=3390576 RepID=UPI003CFC10CD